VDQRADLGVHYLLRGEYDRAVRAFLDVIRDDPSNASAWSYYGIALAHTGRGGEAEAALARAIELGPGNSESWFHLGVARSLREEWTDAASAYRRAVALAPDDMVAWHRLGVALAESGEETGAAAAFERALVLSRSVSDDDDAIPRPTFDDHVDETGAREGSREAKSWLDLSLSLLSLGDEDAAIAAYERAYTLDPKRAQGSLFRPMLRLLTAVQGEPGLPGETVVPTPVRRLPDDDRPAVG
jgi:tetratricopeptide (TPR) repeat protein